MEDLISRQAVLDETIRKNSIWNSITDSEGKNLEEIIFELPSVIPQPSEYFIDGVHAVGYREGYKDAQKQKSGKCGMTRFEDAAQNEMNMSIMVAFCIATYLDKIGIHFSKDEMQQFMTAISPTIEEWLKEESGT